MIQINSTLFMLSLIPLSIAIIVFITSIIIGTIRHRFPLTVGQYVLMGSVIMLFTFLTFQMHQSNDSKYSYQTVHAQVNREYKPNSVTLTDTTVTKTFFNDTRFDSKSDQDNPVVSIVHEMGANTQSNVNKQVNLYLKTITNLNDYRISVKTQQPESHFLSLDTPYSQTVTLTKKSEKE